MSLLLIYSVLLKKNISISVERRYQITTRASQLRRRPFVKLNDYSILKLKQFYKKEIEIHDYWVVLEREMYWEAHLKNETDFQKNLLELFRNYI